jgi:SAM-dependent methyltransferase
MFAPVTLALIENAGIVRGFAVLDVATGPGEPALDVAAFVGPEGRVVGADLVPEMVAAARRASGRLGLRNTQFDVAPADSLPYPADTFDAVISRFGAMFFPSPVDAVREILRVLKPGRKLALAVWHSAETNPFFYTLSRVIERFMDTPPPAQENSDAFRFAASGKLCEVFREAGVLGPSERLLQFTIRAPLSPEDFWTLRREMSEKLREAFAKLSGDQLAEARRQSIEALSAYYHDGAMSLPAEVLIVSGVKSN